MSQQVSQGLLLIIYLGSSLVDEQLGRPHEEAGTSFIYLL